MKNELISVIVPVYKVPINSLKKCIESVQNQSYRNLEIILIDDGSPDECGNICEEYAKNDKRIVVIHQENKGLCGARNVGQEAAKGKWITFLDGDDWLEDKTIENVMNKSKEECDVIIFGTIKDYVDKSFKYNYNTKIVPNKVYYNEECKIFLEETLNFDASIGDVTARLIRTDFLRENNIYHDEEIRQGVEALDFNVRMFKYAKKVVFLHEYYYHYTFNQMSITNDFNIEKCYINLFGYRKIKQQLLKINQPKLMKKFYLRMVHNIVSTAISGFFSPRFEEKYTIKKREYIKYLNIDIVQETLKNVNYHDIEIKSKIILLLIKMHLFHIVEILANIRYNQKNN